MNTHGTIGGAYVGTVFTPPNFFKFDEIYGTNDPTIMQEGGGQYVKIPVHTTETETQKETQLNTSIWVIHVLMQSPNASGDSPSQVYLTHSDAAQGSAGLEKYTISDTKFHDIGFYQYRESSTETFDPSKDIRVIVNGAGGKHSRIFGIVVEYEDEDL